jgi:TPR repeat protein
MDFEKNYEKAKEWFEKAAADDKRYDKWQSSQKSCIELGKIYRDGIGVEKNAAKAIEWFQISGNEGYVNIAVMYRDGIGVKQDFDEAEKWFNKNNAAYTNAKTQEELKKFNEMKKGK